ncbi:dolichyl-phosphate-mannose:protein O-mannosyl transferase [Moesziomyces antarcticus T-34]|jgi:dolichyl-phosphate-mannose-protein mannosyltransferase|uniref:Dolichyl-phosphate-mannose--protein mannosyltransferase n=1 Tax=Pseudozyma antarctica (strain T-34) TaxID=1151754 RepID=M9M4X2_PSEA3|nr:dolichyl-phosphate-mannose:protein O-mannosyl transferase [Moesziomyces antarcticus T-34]
MLPVSRKDAEKRSSYAAIDLDQEPTSATSTTYSSSTTTTTTASYAAGFSSPSTTFDSTYDGPPAYRKRYVDSNDALLPTHSPPTAGHLANDSPRRMASPAPNSRRFAAGFDPYAADDQRTDAASVSDSAALKAKEAGFAPPSPAANSPSSAAKVNKYAHLIPVHKQRNPNLDLVAWTLRQEEVIGLIYTILSLITRLWQIGRSNVVVWDEAHFGKFGSHYLQQEFYFDVHPPLGKMLVGLAGLISGYRGQFEFKSGEKYPADVNYVGMRVILAMFGVAMVPLAWFTSAGLNWNWRARHLLTIMVLLDNGWLVISRFILLDSMLLCFTFTTVHGLVKFMQYKSAPFSRPWWFWLAWTGASIGCVSSVKWVGLFVTALVGVFTVEDLWEKFGDLRMPVRAYARHWCARILCLIFLPLTIYMLSFKAHFAILSRSGPGDAQMSSLFQSHLRGNDFALSPPEAAFGSKVTLKNMGYGGGLLHSHVQTYPVGSQQQQVTCYHYRDNNNEFIITPPWNQPQLPANYSSSEEPIRMVKNGDIIRLVHDQTKRNIHSHNFAAPVTKENLEVSGYGDEKVGDDNDHWVVEVVDDMVLGKVKLGAPVRSLTTRMRLRHHNLNCYLRAANAVLPQWGWKQVEVSCDKENNPKDEHTWWNIENHWNDRLPPGDEKLYRSPFLRDFIHLNVAMMTSNNALIPDADKEDILASKPFDWPWLWNGLRMNSWDDSSIKYYLIGNPVVWWGSSASLVVFAGTWLWYMMRRQRRIHDLSPSDWAHFLYVSKIAAFGWALHYVPFLIMARVCYLHHYLPILYFAVLMLAHLLDHFVWRPTTAVYARGGRRVPLSQTVKNAVFVGAVLAVGGAFWWFSGNSYGYTGDIKRHKGLKWRKSWNIY